MKTSSKNGYMSDDDNVRYKLNLQHFNQRKSTAKSINDDDNIRYMLPNIPRPKPKPEQKKTKTKIKVNFWSNKQNNKLNAQVTKNNQTRRHTIATADQVKPKSTAVKVRKRVSFLPSPLFTENHIPMVTVPDDLTINLNEEEANDLRDDLNASTVDPTESPESPNCKSRSSTTQTSPKGTKRKHDEKTPSNESELEYFSKYVVQKLRRMETNQRIYSENLINTALMLGQLGKLNGKSKIDI